MSFAQPCLVVRSRAGVSVRKASSTVGPSVDLSTQDGTMTFSDNGKLVACTSQGGLVSVFSLPIANEPLREATLVAELSDVADVRMVSLSPQGSFLVTGAKWNKEAACDNVVVWAIGPADEPLKKVFGFCQKVLNKEDWPLCHWTQDQKWMARKATNEIQLHDGKEPSRVSHRLKVEGLASFSLAPIPTAQALYHVATFVPGSQTAGPARIGVVVLPDHINSGKTVFVEDPKFKASKSTFKAEDVEMKWNSTGTAVLVRAQTDVDTTGKTYYGESNIVFIKADGTFTQQLDTNINGPSHAMEWSPNGKEFITVTGFMPAHATLYNLQCKMIQEFGANHRNTIKFSPSGNLLCLGGFGNLTGNMDFYEKKDTKFELIGSAQAACAVLAEWCPDGKHFMTAVCTPRMRVDNGYKLWKYTGALVHTQEVQELYEVVWQPCKIKEQPLSPRQSRDQPVVQPKVQAYRPPGAQGTSKVAEMMMRERLEASSKPAPTLIAQQLPRDPIDDFIRSLPPGADIDAEVKSYKKKEAQKKKKEQKEQEKKAQEAGGAEATSDTKHVTPVLTEEQMARVKTLNKKLKEIQKFKEKASAGQSLTPSQSNQIEKEEELTKELAALELGN